MKRSSAIAALLLITVCGLFASSSGIAPDERQETIIRIPSEGYMFLGFSLDEPESTHAPDAVSGELAEDGESLTAELSVWAFIRTDWKDWNVYVSVSPLVWAGDPDVVTDDTYIPFEFTAGDAAPVRVHMSPLEETLLIKWSEDLELSGGWKKKLTVKAFLDGNDGKGKERMPGLMNLHQGTITLRLETRN